LAPGGKHWHGPWGANHDLIDGEHLRLADGIDLWVAIELSFSSLDTRKPHLRLRIEANIFDFCSFKHMSGAWQICLPSNSRAPFAL
jgi:hypothetical protein